MRLGYKSRVLLDMILAAGGEAIGFMAFPRGLLSQSCGWEDARSVKRSLKRLHDDGWIVWDDSHETGEWAVKLTGMAREVMTGEADPEQLWNRQWDGQWLTVAFDLPAHLTKVRRELLDWLHEHRFGCLQQSLWISPWFDEAWESDLAQWRFDPVGVSLLRGTSVNRTGDADFVRRSWKFSRINDLYRALLECHKDFFAADSSEDRQSWTRKEQRIWTEVKRLDPFLPNELLPKGYLGKQAYAKRRETYLRLAQT